MWFLVGAVGLPAPEKGAEIFGFSLQEGTLGYLIYEMFGSTCIGLAIMRYLATHKTISAPKISMYRALSCFYMTYRATLKGSFKKAGFMDYFGVIQCVYFAVCVHGIQTGNWDSTLAAKLLTAFPLLLGLIGSVDPNTAEKLMGLSAQTDGATNTVLYFGFTKLFSCGVF